MKQTKAFGKGVLATVLFWAIVILGPFAIVIWNDLSLVRYDRGTLGYLFFATIIQGIAAAIAWNAASYIFDGAYCRATGINCIVCATLLVVLALVSASSVQELISDGLAIVILVVGAVVCFRKYDAKKAREAKKREEIDRKFEELLKQGNLYAKSDEKK